ncbi:MAG: hypothetical protein ACLUD2_11345 [Clostridium sp.]
MKKGGKTGNMIAIGTAFCISLSPGAYDRNRTCMADHGNRFITLAATGNDVNQFQYMAMGISRPAFC